MKLILQYKILLFFILITINNLFAQVPNDCANAVNICNNQLAEKLDDGPGVQECPSGGCGCMKAGEKNTRWFRIVIATDGVLEFTISPYNGSADYDFSVWNRGASGTCPTNLGSPDRCNYAATSAPTGIKGNTNGNSNGASGNLFSNSMNVAAGDVIYLLIDNWDGTNVGFRLDFFGGTSGSGTGTTATFSCAAVNTCSTCSKPDCSTYRFDSPSSYSFAETAANGGCHSNFAVNTKKATVCGTFTVPAPYTTVQFPLDRGIEITSSASNNNSCLSTATSHITYQVWGVCGSPLTPLPGTGIYTGLNNSTTYKVCKTVDVSSGSADCYLSRICLPYWIMVQNDDPCGALPLTVNAAPTNGTNAGASSGFNAGCTGYNDVWYKFTAPASGRVQINVIPNATSDVKVSLVGPQAGMKGGVSNCDKSCDQMTDIAGGCNDFAGVGGAERLFSFVVPGQTYLVWISGTASKPTANFSVQVTETITNNAQPTPGPELTKNGGTPGPIPANDDCSNAIDLNPLCSPKAGTNIGATAICTDPDPQYVAAITLENDVWYKWTAPSNNGNAQVTLEVTGVSCSDGAGIGTSGLQFGIFKGSCAALTPVSNGTTTVTFTPISGQTYYFVVDGNAGSQCNFNINIKRANITSQTCNSGNFCTGSSLSASFNYTYNGANPGYRWAYCKSSTWNSPCTIDLDNPSTYQIYNPAVGLPNPGCTPATYTFVGYILADNGATTIAPGYPTPQPASANCVRATSPCTFNIYPDIRNTVTVTSTPCSQIVAANAACSPAAPIVITGTTNQTASPGTSGKFSNVTVTWQAPYAATAPANCGSYDIQNSYACPGSTGSATCPGPMLTVGAPAIASSTVGIAYNSSIDLNTTSYPWISCDNYGKGVWFNFVAPMSGNADIKLTNVSAWDPLIMLFDSRQWVSTGTGSYVPQSDVCSSCSDMSTRNGLAIQYVKCQDAAGAGGAETMQVRGLNPGETYFVLIDAYEGSANKTGTFSLQVVDAGGGPVRPANDDCLGAFDLTAVCKSMPGTNINATSLCSNDLAIPNASTENSVWYTYTATTTGPTTIKYQYATGTHCAAVGAQPGIQFALYTSSDNTCNGTFTNIPAGTVSTGTINGAVTLNLTAGQKYYILIDGYGGNECNYEFQIYSGKSCCTADLGATEGTDKILCFGDDVTYGVTANPIDFGNNTGSNPVIGWQLSLTQPAVINPFNPKNNSNGFLVGQIDTVANAGTLNQKVYRDVEGNFPDLSISYPTINNTTTDFPITIGGFPAGAVFNATTDTISICINTKTEYFTDMKISLVSPSGIVFPLVTGQCGTQVGYLNVCFSNYGTTGTVSAYCPLVAGGEISGIYLPVTAWSSLNGATLNGQWKIRITDAAHSSYQTYFLGASIDIKKPYYTYIPKTGIHHGDLHIVNNDPYKYGAQVFWLTPITFVNYNVSAGLLTTDSCYSYGTPVKVTMLEKMTTPNVTPTCNPPSDGSAGVGLIITSPKGGWPTLSPTPVPTQYYNFTGIGAASGITFPSSPSAGIVGAQKPSSSFAVLDGQSWGVTFIDNNGCKSNVNGTFEKPNVGQLNVDPAACKGNNLQFSVSQPPPMYSKYKISIDFDNYPQDISWNLYDGSNNIVESGGGYATNLGFTTYTTGLIDPNKGPYRFEVYDGFGDGLGSGGGSTNGGGNSTANYILIEELNAMGGSTVLYNNNYAFCSPLPCVPPSASVFSVVKFALGTPVGGFSSGVVANVYNGNSCAGAPIAGIVTQNSNSTGIVNTATLTPGATYSLHYSYTDKYSCVTNLCKPFELFPTVTINPTVNCSVNPPKVSVNATCLNCNANYIAEYSYNDGYSWSTVTTANFQDIFTFAHVKNLSTGAVACEVSSAKLGDCPTVLPLELIYIKASTINNEYVKLTWATASEMNVGKFEILRSTDAINFIKIAEVVANGNTKSVSNYTYDDYNAQFGVVYYYQIKEIDNDNHFNLTNIVNAKIDKDGFELVGIYPNPTIDNTTLTFYTKDQTDVELTIYNDIGELMKNEQKIIKEGLSKWEIPTDKWAKGVYYFLIKNNEKTITKQIVKLQ